MLKKRFLQIIKGLAIAIVLVIIIYLLFLFVETFLLPFYVFILLLVVTIFVWVKNPALKAKRLIPFVSVVTVLILVWITWQFRTYEPMEKNYSIDKQYSYYLAKYNYNKIAEYHPFFFFDKASYEYKAYVYDEIKQKRLTSGSVGDIEWNERYGFSDYDDYFWFKSGTYKLPRPIDPEAIKRKNEKRKEREKAYQDSRLQVKECDERPAFRLQFKNETKELIYEREELHWRLIDVNKPFIVKVSYPRLHDVYLFKIPFVAKDTSIKFSIEFEDDKFKFQVFQLSDTVHSDEFFFERDDRLWDLTYASHTIYKDQSADDVREYIFEPNIFTYIDVEKMEKQTVNND